MAEKASQSSTREARSVSEKHMEVMVVGDHLYLQRFNSEDEATKILLLLAHMVRHKSGFFNRNYFYEKKQKHPTFPATDLGGGSRAVHIAHVFPHLAPATCI